jgi:hypothetical protein
LPLSGSFWPTSPSSGSSAAEEILLLFLVVRVVPFAHDGSVGIDLVVIVRVFGAVPQAVAVILIDGPAAIFVFVIVVRTLAATEATEVIPVVVVRKP